MRFIRSVRQYLLCLIVCLSASASQLLAGADVAEPRLASATAKELWRKSSDQILTGDFRSAYSTLEEVQRIEPGHKEVDSAISWMREAKSLAESRERLRSKTFDYYVAKAKEACAEAREAAHAKPKTDTEPKKEEKAAEKKGKTPEGKGSTASDRENDKGFKWSKALSYALAAMANSKDEEAFRGEPWLKEIVDNTLVEIGRHKAANEWRDAVVLYDFLQKLFPKNKDFEAGFDFCGKRAHLEIVYGPKGTWSADLRDVTAPVLNQIVERIDGDYVEAVDFKKLTRSGLDNLLILAQADSLTKTFHSLGDKDLVNVFSARIKSLQKNRVDGRSNFAAKHVEEVFKRVLDANSESVRLPEAVLVDEFVSGMLEKLDEFTSVIWPDAVDEFNKHTRGEFVGVGIQITQDTGSFIRVETPLEDSPAYMAGVKPGDLITEVDGKSTQQMTITQAVKIITGPPGTNVTLTIKDSVTTQTREITLVRGKIKLRTVHGHERDGSKPTKWDYMIDPAAKIGYVRVSSFADKTIDDLEKALDQMHDDGCRGMILDLRFNPGGLLTAAVHMSEMFVAADDPIVQTRGRGQQQSMTINSKSDRKFPDVPLIVLVNEYSASASEIVAGAVAGLKEACIVGDRTFGKGSVQNLIPIADSHAYLKLTTAHYYVHDNDRPDDPWYCLHRNPGADAWGVDPHVTVKLIPQEMNKVLRLRRERDLLKGRNQSEIPKDVLDRRPTSEPAEALPQDEDPNTDPQIVTAVNMMRIKLMSKQPWALAPRQVRALSRADAKVKDADSH